MSLASLRQPISASFAALSDGALLVVARFDEATGASGILSTAIQDVAKALRQLFVAQDFEISFDEDDSLESKLSQLDAAITRSAGVVSRFQGGLRELQRMIPGSLPMPLVAGYQVVRRVR